MKLIIDNLTNTTGWSASAEAAIHGVNEIKDFIAGNNSSSIIFNFNGINSYVEKTYGTDVSDYDELILWVYSNNLKEDKTYSKASDYSYKIGVDSTNEYYLHTRGSFYYVSINIKDIDTLEKIRITALTGSTDYLFVSYMLVTKDNFPFDVYEGIKEQLEYERDTFHSLKLLGQISGSTGDTPIDRDWETNNP